MFPLMLLLLATDLKIDHVTVAGRDLKQLQSALQSVGVPTVYGGAHGNGVTEMALASFPDGSYLEAIAVQPNADPAALDRHKWAQFLKQDSAACDWAIQSGNIVADHRRLAAVGIEVSDPVRAGRRRPDGVRLEWETADIGSALFPFLIQDFTPRPLRAFPQGKPTLRDFTGVSTVVIAVRNLPAAIEQYRKAFGLPDALRQTDQDLGVQLAVLGSAPVILAQPLRPGSWIDERLQRFGEGPCAFILRAARPSKYKAVSKSRWFVREISWFDPARLGWRLGFEPAP